MASSLVLSSAFAHAETLRYDPESPVPAGYHVEERPRIALAITGGALAATGAGLIAYGAIERAAERRQFEESRAADPNYEGTAGISGGTMTMYFGAAFAAVGVPLLIVGLASKKSVLVRDDVSFVPLASSTFGGFALAATF